MPITNRIAQLADEMIRTAPPHQLEAILPAVFGGAPRSTTFAT